MPERLKKRALRVVGARQVLRAMKAGKAEKVFLAMNRAGLFCGGDACGEAEAESELRELVKLLQELLAV